MKIAVGLAANAGTDFTRGKFDTGMTLIDKFTVYAGHRHAGSRQEATPANERRFAEELLASSAN